VVTVKELATCALRKAAVSSPFTSLTAHAFDKAFLNELTVLIKSRLPAGLKIDQKHKTQSEKLYDICVYEQEVVSEVWCKSVTAVSNVLAAIEIENRQGPTATFEDIWKVVFANVPHRIYLGGYSVGKKDQFISHKGRLVRLNSIKQHFGDKALGLLVGFYPRPKTWIADQIDHEVHVYEIT